MSSFRNHPERGEVILLILIVVGVLLGFLDTLTAPFIRERLSLSGLLNVKGDRVTNPCYNAERCLVVVVSKFSSCCNCPPNKSFVRELLSEPRQPGTELVFVESRMAANGGRAGLLSEILGTSYYRDPDGALRSNRVDQPTQGVWLLDRSFNVLASHREIPSELNARGRAILREKFGTHYNSFFVR